MGCGCYFIITPKAENKIHFLLYAGLSGSKNCISFTSTEVTISFSSSLPEIVVNCLLHCDSASKIPS